MAPAHRLPGGRKVVVGSFLEPRYECPQIATVLPGGVWRRCGSHLRVVAVAPDLGWCSLCECYSLLRYAHLAADPRDVLPVGALDGFLGKDVW